jgi:GNAT superfamily N-acetyltransferase
MDKTLTVRPVTGAAERRAFITFPWRIYAAPGRRDPLWVAPLLPERLARLDPQRSPFFVRGGQAELFIAWRGAQPVGVICAGDDCELNRQRGLKDCVFGFFECENNYETACALFDAAADWGRRRGLEQLYGPFNLDYEDAYGFQLEGWERPPALLCGHTPPYYAEFAERYGLLPARGDNLAFAIGLDFDTPEWQRVARLAERLRRHGTVHLRGARLERWDDEVDAILDLLNRATAHLPDFIPWQRGALEETLAAFKQIADPELILFAEVERPEGGMQAVGWFPAVPNLNEAFIHANGLRHPWDYLKLALAMRRPVKSLTIKSVLVLPEYWNMGVGVLLMDEMARRVKGRGIEWIDLSLTSADNPATPGLANRMGATLYKRYRVYRKPIT